MKPFRCLKSKLVLCAFSLPSATFALSLDPFELDRFPVHPSGADESTASLTVVDAEDSTFRAADLKDLLLTVPGVHLHQAGGPGGRSTLYLRGGDENHVAVYFDGVPLNDPTNNRGGGVDFSLLSPASIAKVAVVRGPASVRYGPEAIAGVVHLQSAPLFPHQSALASAGGQDFHRAQISWADALSSASSIGVGTVHDADGKDSQGGSYQRKGVQTRFESEGAIKITGSLWYFRQNATAFPDDSGGIRHALQRELEVRQHTVGGASTRLARELPQWTLSLEGDFSQFDSEVTSPGVLPGMRDPNGLPASEEDSRLRRSRVQLLAETELGTLSWATGFDLQRESGSASGALYFGPMAQPTNFQMTRDRLGVFAEAGSDLPAGMRWQAGARADRMTGEAWQSTLRTGLLGTLGHSAQWRINIGNAFKAPSFYALSNPLVGNPDLRPETSRTYEAGYRHFLGSNGSYFDLTVFTSRSRDQVEFVSGPPPRMENLDHVKADGFEWAWHWQMHRVFRLTSSLSYVDAKVRQTGEALRGRAKWSGGVRAEWTPLAELRIGASLKATDRILDSSIPTGEMQLSGWTRLDVDLDWRVRDELSLMLAIDNLLNSQYEEAVGFLSRPRRVRTGMVFRF